ncbi:MAG: hypothetical protein MK213_05875, partial [Planctomycetes bacterium]|nr:hypothetical protein [Planctomycetota bacterium]
MALLPILEGLHSAEAFNPAFLRAFLERVRQIQAQPEAVADALQGKLIGMVFEEPSTRTRLSFEAAAHRLGAKVIGVSDPSTSSSAKGESLADAARVIGSYADLLVWRHARDGASRLVSQVADAPVVNGGDGRLGHPTQTLVDLATLHAEWGSFEGKTVGILGDLRHGRTARSLAWGLSLLGARVVPLPGPDLAWEGGFEARIFERAHYRSRRVSHPLFRGWTGAEECNILEPTGLVQASLFRDQTPRLESLDALYLTRLQAERGAQSEKSVYPGLLRDHLENSLLSNCLFLHPLPRREELPTFVDQDPRARYFEQAALGPTVRMAVFLAMLADKEWSLPPLSPLPAGNPDGGLGPCPNPNCVTQVEEIPVPWRIAGSRQRLFLCAYCDQRMPVDYAGCRSSRRVHAIHSQAVLRIR